jgi:short subunit dehydrogenase-like uncharacterized protein
MARVVLFGATGYTGRLTARAMIARGLRPVLVGRSAAKLEEVAAETGGAPEVAVADLSCPGSLAALLTAGDVLVTTVGPFARLGDVAAQAAIGRGAHYLDSNGEPAFTRRVFERYGPAAAARGIGMLTAFGWENVLGNLSGALALRDAGERAVRVDTGYFYVGAVGFSGGTRASFADAMVLPGFAFRDGAIRTVGGGDRYRTMPVGGAARPGVSFGASEHLALPRCFPQLQEVNAYQGWFGRISPRLARLLHSASRAGFAALRVPGARALSRAALQRLTAGSSAGPTERERASGGVHVVAIAYDAQGVPLSEVHLAGAEGYEFTATILAWGAERMAAEEFACTGAFGPVEAFGIDELAAGCREAGVGHVARP